VTPAAPSGGAGSKGRRKASIIGMGKIVSLANQKGGVGKTTTAINLSASLAACERNVLLVDLDPQANATSGVGISKNEENSMYPVLTDGLNIREIIRQTELPNFHVAPSSVDLVAAELELSDAIGREFHLRRALQEIAGEYDYILIDSPPSLGLLTINGLTAANSVLVPMQCEYFAIEGVAQLLNTIERVRDLLNPGLEIEGIALTMYDERMNLARQVADEVRTHFADKVYQTVIPRNVRLGEAPSFGKPIILYDIRSRGSEAYINLAKEFIQRAETVLT
jgi:chromosome partitioning protein